MLQYIKNLLKKIYYYYAVVRDCGNDNIIKYDKNIFKGKLTITIFGNNNKISIDASCILNDVDIIIWGDNNVFTMDKDSKIQVGRIKMYDGATISIGRNATFQEVSFVMKGKRCVIGIDCMFSDGIKIRNIDGHKIVDKSTNEIMNPPQDIILGNHVWIGQDVTILKNAKIHDGSIIGCKALVTGNIESDCIAVGIPAKVIKNNVTWIRH